MDSDSETLTLSEPPDDKDAEIAALKRRVAELEASQAKPKPPPVSLAPASTIPDELRRPPPSAVSSMHAVQAAHAARLHDLVGRVAPRRLGDLLSAASPPPSGLPSTRWRSSPPARRARRSPPGSRGWRPPTRPTSAAAARAVGGRRAGVPARAARARPEIARRARAAHLRGCRGRSCRKLSAGRPSAVMSLSLCEEGGDGAERLALPPAPLRRGGGRRVLAVCAATRGRGGRGLPSGARRGGAGGGGGGDGEGSTSCRRGCSRSIRTPRSRWRRRAPTLHDQRGEVPQARGHVGGRGRRVHVDRRGDEGDRGVVQRVLLGREARRLYTYPCGLPDAFSALERVRRSYLAGPLFTAVHSHLVRMADAFERMAVRGLVGRSAARAANVDARRLHAHGHNAQPL